MAQWLALDHLYTGSNPAPVYYNDVLMIGMLHQSSSIDDAHISNLSETGATYIGLNKLT